jgi:hypothetical protein
MVICLPLGEPEAIELKSEADITTDAKFELTAAAE